MFQGIASSTRRSYEWAQRKFLEFCRWSQGLHADGSALPASEWTLMLLATYLAKTIKASSIKVYLAGIRSLHIENGFPNPLTECLRLERVLRGIKRSQGVSTRERLPVTFTVLTRLLFWAACCTGFFGFLRSGEFTTTNSKFDSRIHLSVDDVRIDKHVNTSVIFLHIKCSKTDPFRQGHTIRLWVSGNVVRAVRALLRYLHVRGGDAGPLFRHTNGKPTDESNIHSVAQKGGVSCGFRKQLFRP